jgi:hypothetical protein
MVTSKASKIAALKRVADKLIRLAVKRQAIEQEELELREDVACYMVSLGLERLQREQGSVTAKPRFPVTYDVAGILEHATRKQLVASGSIKILKKGFTKLAMRCPAVAPYQKLGVPYTSVTVKTRRKHGN